MYGPLPAGFCALLIGRSSTSKAGLFVLPGVIDTDYTGEIKIMAWTPTPPCTIPAGERIAQLILLPNVQREKGDPILGQQRGSAGFGSTGLPRIFWTQKITMGQPMLMCKVNGRAFTGLVDTGADVSIIQRSEWPSDWPLVQVFAAVTGVGGTQIPWQSLHSLLVEGPENKHAMLKPYVLNVPCTLWGRDLLQQWNVALTTHF